MSLFKVLSDITEFNYKFCALCFRTEKVRELKVSRSLNALVSLLDADNVWLWKLNKRMEHYVCQFCEARVSSALRTVNMVCFAVRCVKLLDGYRKKQSLDNHLLHLSLRCQKDLRHFRRHTELQKSEMMWIEEQKSSVGGISNEIYSSNIELPLSGVYVQTYSNNNSRTKTAKRPLSTRNISHSISFSANNKTLTINPLTPSTNPNTATMNPNTATMNPNTVSINPNMASMNPNMASLNPNTASVILNTRDMNPLVPILQTYQSSKSTIKLGKNPITLGMNPSTSSMSSTMLGMNSITPVLYPMTPSMNTSTPGMNTITSSVNATAAGMYSSVPSVITSSAGLNTITPVTTSITPQMIETGMDSITASNTISNEIDLDPDLYIKSETESVASENQIEDDFDNLDDYIIPTSVREVAKKRTKQQINKNEKKQKSEEPISLGKGIKLVPQDKLLQPKVNTIIPETNPIQSEKNTINQEIQSVNQAVNTGRILACTLNNGDMAFCPIVAFAGKDYVPALKCVLENGVLSPVENIDWEKLALLTNSTDVNDMMTGLAQANIQGVLSKIGKKLKPLPNDMALNDIKTNVPQNLFTNPGASTLKQEMTDAYQLNSLDSAMLQGRMGISQGGMATLQGANDAIRLQDRDTIIKGGMATLQGANDARFQDRDTIIQGGMASSQGGMATSQGGMATLQGGMATLQGGMVSSQGGTDTPGALLQEIAKFGSRNVSRTNTCKVDNNLTLKINSLTSKVENQSGSKVIKKRKFRYDKVSKLVIFDNKVPKLIIPKLIEIKGRNKTFLFEQTRKNTRSVAKTNSGYRNPSVASLDNPMPSLGYSTSQPHVVTPDSVARNQTISVKNPENIGENCRVDTPKLSLSYSVASQTNNATRDSVARNKTTVMTVKNPEQVEESFRVFAQNDIQNNMQPKRSDANIDWEDKIPMDVITYMNATDPNAAKYIKPSPSKPRPAPSASLAPPAVPLSAPLAPLAPPSVSIKDSAFGFISSCVGADDVICLD